MHTVDVVNCELELLDLRIFPLFNECGKKVVVLSAFCCCDSNSAVESESLFSVVSSVNNGWLNATLCVGVCVCVCS